MNTFPVLAPVVCVAVGAPIQILVHLNGPPFESVSVDGWSATVPLPTVLKPPGNVKFVTADPLYRVGFAIIDPFATPPHGRCQVAMVDYGSSGVHCR